MLEIEKLILLCVKLPNVISVQCSLIGHGGKQLASILTRMLWLHLRRWVKTFGHSSCRMDMSCRVATSHIRVYTAAAHGLIRLQYS